MSEALNERIERLEAILAHGKRILGWGEGGNSAEYSKHQGPHLRRVTEIQRCADVAGRTERVLEESAQVIRELGEGLVLARQQLASVHQVVAIAKEQRAVCSS